VAGKLLEEFGRPVLVLEKGLELAHGSARSVADFDMVAALTYAKDLLDRYGGHTQAAGFTLQNHNITAFHEKLLEYAESVATSFADPVLEIDSELSDVDINWENYDYINKLSPFGVGNPKPKFVSYGMELVGSRVVGSDGRHLKLQLRLGQKYINAIAFGQGFLSSMLMPGKKLDAVYQLEANEWNGNKELEIKIIDLKLND
jgi:single-stranded-DNA-specific exonuclease